MASACDLIQMVLLLVFALFAVTFSSIHSGWSHLPHKSLFSAFDSPFVPHLLLHSESYFFHQVINFFLPSFRNLEHYSSSTCSICGLLSPSAHHENIQATTCQHLFFRTLPFSILFLQPDFTDASAALVCRPMFFCLHCLWSSCFSRIRFILALDLICSLPFAGHDWQSHTIVVSNPDLPCYSSLPQILSPLVCCDLDSCFRR